MANSNFNPEKVQVFMVVDEIMLPVSHLECAIPFESRPCCEIEQPMDIFEDEFIEKVEITTEEIQRVLAYASVSFKGTETTKEMIDKFADAVFDLLIEKGAVEEDE